MTKKTNPIEPLTPLEQLFKEVLLIYTIQLITFDKRKGFEAPYFIAVQPRRPWKKRIVPPCKHFIGQTLGDALQNVLDDKQYLPFAANFLTSD